MNITRNGFRAFLFIIVDLCIVYGFTRFGSLSMLTKRVLVERIITYGSCHQEEAFGSKSNLNTRGGHTTLQRYIRNKNVVYVNNVLPLWALQIYSRPSLHKQIFLFDREKCTSMACR